ncbi:hypothetical protein MCUN1_001936 [Malassezia cuniculi]|uniref:GH16 domain-containing protein n=1 Tax=Malassezia cuniculi TaxID=948313 RepID=A0AAF0EUX5_9BASI|nr:hypothetical protein MCUN1_001936 [Malassezia cuniculi]
MSCVPNPVCAPKDFDVPPVVYNDSKVFRPIINYNGDPTLGQFTFESGYLGAGEQGVLLQMTKERESRISTTTYMVYGEASIKVRREPQNGIVSTFALLSNIGDAAIWQFSGNNGSRINTHYFSMGNQTTLVGREHNGGKNFTYGDFHTYGIRWNPESMEFTLDGKVFRTVQRNATQGNYPQSPARVQITTWGTTNLTNKQVLDWAGSPSYETNSYKSNGFYALELAHLTVTCADISKANVSTTGVGSSPVAYYYTNTSTARPIYMISRDQIHTIADPSKDAPEGTPGYPGQNVTGPMPNMWTGAIAKSSSSSSSPPSPDLSTSGNSNGSGVNNGIKIGIPVGIGGAILAVILGVSIAWYMRHRAKERRRRQMLERMYPPNSGTSAAPEAYNMVPVPETYPQQEYYAQPEEQQGGVEYDPLTAHEYGVNMHDSSPILTKEEDYYYQDPYGTVDPVYQVPFDDESIDGHSARPQHYAGHDDIYHMSTDLRREDRRRAREALREAAFGDEGSAFFQSRSSRRTSEDRSRKKPSRAELPNKAVYSRGGAIPDSSHP